MKGSNIYFDLNNDAGMGDHRSPIQRFYAGKNIFLTGGTGSIGLVLLESLMTRCPDIDKIYLLLRKKKGKDIQIRLNELLESVVLSKIAKGWKNKIVPIEGELGQSDLGLSKVDRQLLVKNVNIVFHCAATVRFDAKLRVAVKINVIGTLEVVHLCHAMDNLQAFVHVSTAFANCIDDINIEEKIRDVGLSLQDVYAIAECANDEELEAITPKLLKKWVNTYSFTKSVSENLLVSEGKNLPVTIFRPGLVMGTSGRHPFSGYISSFYGPSGLIIGVGMGLIRTLHLDPEQPALIVPGDYCVNGILVAAWDIAQNKYDEIPIYNYVPPSNNVMSWSKVIENWLNTGYEMPLPDTIWWPNIEVTGNIWKFYAITIFTQLLPAAFFDFVMIASRKNPLMLGIQRKVYKFLQLLDHFLSKSWALRLDGVSRLHSRMSAKDRDLFYINMEDLDWKNYCVCLVHGLRVYLKNEKPKSIPKSLKKLQRLKYLHFGLTFLFIVVSIYLCRRWLLYCFSR